MHYLSTDFDLKKESTRGRRRERAQAELRACELEEHRAQAEQALAQARLAEFRAQLDEMDRYAAEQRRREHDEWNRAYDRRQEAMDQLRALAKEPLPHVPMTRDEQRELLAELDAALAAGEHEGEGLFYHGGRLWDRSRF